MFPVSHPMRIVLLAVGLALLSSQPSGAQNSRTIDSGTSSLQDRLVALTQLIHYRHRGDAESLQQHRAEVEAVLSEWNKVTQPSSADQQLMAAWMDRAIRSSMPGKSGKLPQSPRFGIPIVQAPAILRPALLREEQVEPIVETEQPVAIEDNLFDTWGMPTASSSEPRQQSVTEPAASPRRSKWSRHPAAAPLKWSDPFENEPQSNANPFRGKHRYATHRPVFEEGGIEVDLAELSAEVRGYNAALRSLNQRLASRSEISTRALSQIANELERLETERRFLDLYREGLSQAEQQSLPTSPSAELVYEVVRRKTAVRLSKTPQSKSKERRALEGLAARLARL